jgi:anhydro-N-acetylmuramic acid kinase
MILNTLKEWQIDPALIDVIASHGQTVFHSPFRLHKNNDFGSKRAQNTLISNEKLKNILKMPFF